MAAEVWSIKRLLQWTQQFLKEKNIESPRLEAEILLAHVLGCQRIDLYVRTDESPDEGKRTLFRGLIKKRVEGCPVAYLVGQREFFRLNVRVTPAVLIPRPETEFLVVEALRLLKDRTSPTVVDVGTGSGCIALTIAQQHKSARVTAIDISAEALAVAVANAKTLALAERVRFLEGDLLTPVAGESFDLIVSNPPYIASAEIDTLAPDVRNYEPRQALDGGADGLGVYRRLIGMLPGRLNPGGQVLLEIGSTQEASVTALLNECGLFGNVKTFLDGQRLPRVLRAW